jgi:hypothetical protein
MKRAIFTAALLLIAGAIAASPQVNTFCAANLACTVSAAWNFSAGLQSGGVNVLTNPVNLGTQVTGTLAGANYAAVNLAAGNVNGGATGVLPGANMAATNLAGGNNPGGVSGSLPLANIGPLQGTDTSLLTSGTVSASTGAALCTDANHGATTTGCAAGGVSEAIVTSTVTSGVCASGSPSNCGAFFIPANAHTLTRLVSVVTTAGSGCSANAQWAIIDITNANAVLASGTPSNIVGTVTDSGALSVAMTAAHRFALGMANNPTGCSIFEAAIISADYQ